MIDLNWKKPKQNKRAKPKRDSKAMKKYKLKIKKLFIIYYSQ